MTGNYEQMLPLLVSCFCAYIVAEALKDVPIYEALLERDLLRGGLAHRSREPIVIEFEVEPASPFVGREVRDLGLPPGCVLVRYYGDHRESVTTRLAPHSRITAVIQPDTPEALLVLRRGCQAANGSD
jgi:chloride channel protein, CIC family